MAISTVNITGFLTICAGFSLNPDGNSNQLRVDQFYFTVGRTHCLKLMGRAKNIQPAARVGAAGRRVRLQSGLRPSSSGQSDGVDPQCTGRRGVPVFPGQHSDDGDRCDDRQGKRPAAGRRRWLHSEYIIVAQSSNPLPLLAFAEVYSYSISLESRDRRDCSASSSKAVHSRQVRDDEHRGRRPGR